MKRKVNALFGAFATMVLWLGLVMRPTDAQGGEVTGKLDPRWKPPQPVPQYFVVPQPP